MAERMAYLGVRRETRLADIYCGESVPERLRMRMMRGMTVLHLPVPQARVLLGRVVPENRIERYRCATQGVEACSVEGGRWTGEEDMW